MAGGDIDEVVTAWISDAEAGLDQFTTDDWLEWGAHVLPLCATRVVEARRQREAKEQSWAAEMAHAIADRDAKAALRVAE